MPRTIMVVPCFNEERRFSSEAFRSFARQWEDGAFLLIDDGSSDNTLDVLHALQDSMPRWFRVLSLPRNAGKAEAVRRGIVEALRSAPEYVGFWDADLATPLSVVPLFEAVFTDRPSTEIVMGARVKLLGRRIKRNVARHYLGRCFATAVTLVLGLDVYDSQCGAKMFRATEAIRSVFETPFLSRWIFDVEILARFIKIKRSMTHRDIADYMYELPLPEWSDRAGSKVRAVDFVRALFDLWRIRRTVG